MGWVFSPVAVENDKKWRKSNMKKYVALLLTLAMVLTLFAGCAGTTVVYYTDCTCPAENHNPAPKETQPVAEETEAPAVEETQAPAAEGAVKTGLAIVAGVDATNATAEEAGAASFDVTLVGILVDDNGVITDCAIDSIGTTVNYDTTGAVTSDVTAEVLTKNELGDNYNMVAFGGAIAEWYVQAEALAQYCVGKTLDEVLNGAIDESGYAADADLAASATINLYAYVNAIQAAYGNAVHLGAQAGDELVLTSLNSLADSTALNAQLNCDAVALTRNGDAITSCYIDALQAKVAIDETGAATVTNTKTKNELGYDYGMVAYAQATYEWFEQAASFGQYVTGKTAADVAGIAVSEGKATDADLASSVTIAIGGFQALIAKACQ